VAGNQHTVDCMGSSAVAGNHMAAAVVAVPRVGVLEDHGINT